MLRRSTLPILAVALALVSGAAARSAAPDTVTAATFVLRGHGWGHGVGLAQWGAYGFARNGGTYDEILGHYYPGTELAAAPATRVRVLVASGTSCRHQVADFAAREAVHPARLLRRLLED